MHTSVGVALERTRSIPLGIRIAVAGSFTFCQEVRRILSADPDVAFIHELDSIGRMNESILRVHALITEPSADFSSMERQQIESLSGVSLIAVVGSTLGAFAGLPNAQRFAPIERHNAQERIESIKERVLQIRFQEFSGFVNALMSDQDSSSDNEPVLEIQDVAGPTRIPVARIDWIKAAGNHVEVRESGRSYFHRSEMQTLERQLPAPFVRIHRKIIINLNRLLRIDVDSSIRQFATLITGERFLISRHRINLVHARWAELRGQSA